MKSKYPLLLLVLAMQFSVIARANDSQAESAPGIPPVTRARFFPAPGHEKAMLGGKFCGSNVSERSGYELLAEITSVPPAGQWSEITWPSKKYYRWLRYEAPPGSHGNVAEIEFYSGTQKVGFGAFGSLGHRNFQTFGAAMDGKTDTWFDSSVADGQYVGTDVGFWVDSAPTMDPPPGEKTGPLQVTLKCSSPHATIRYSFEGAPGPNEGTVYSKPIQISHRTTLFAVAYRKGFAPSPTTQGTYFINEPPKPGLSTFHIGNSLTGSTLELSRCALTAGWKHDYHWFLLGGSDSAGIWDTFVMHPDKPNNDKITWNQALSSLTKLDDMTVQVWGVDLNREADYDIRFFNTLRAKFPEMQPWFYSLWTGMFATLRPVAFGQVPSFEMKMLSPALTWEEVCSAWLLYAEDVKTKVLQTYGEGKKPRILPCSIAAGWLRNLIDNGKFPGFHAGDFPLLILTDNFHPGSLGRYLVDLIWYSAFYGESPVGKVMPGGNEGTDLSPEQMAVIQNLAWDVVQNYPDCGLYKEGPVPVGQPECSPAPAAITKITPVTLKSSTPGAWFRYTLDGTTPTRTCGYVYCGVISVRPGMTLKAVAYKSGMADSPAIEMIYPTANGIDLTP